MDCVNCEEPIRRIREDDGLDLLDYEWVHETGNVFCDLGKPVASPGGDGYGPAPVTGYLVDGKVRDPSEVTVIRREMP